MGWKILVIGLLVALAASACLLMGMIESGLAAAIGMLGIGVFSLGLSRYLKCLK
jgi:hypothetical protein